MDDMAIFMLIIDCCFFLDVIVNFKLTYQDEERRVVESLARSRRSTWQTCSCPTSSILPFSWLLPNQPMLKPPAAAFCACVAC